MRSYCSIFDKNYLFQGLTVFKSLSHSSSDYIYYPLCMDIESYEQLQKMNLEKMNQGFALINAHLILMEIILQEFAYQNVL